MECLRCVVIRVRGVWVCVGMFRVCGVWCGRSLWGVGYGAWNVGMECGVG